MNRLERSGYLAHARTAGYRRREAFALEVIARALESARSPYISLSCGKDSSAMCALVLECAPSIPIRIATAVETRYLHRNLDDCLNWWRRAYPLVSIHEIDYRRNTDGQIPPREPGPSMVQSITEFAAFDICFVGVRGAESRARKFSNRYFRDDPRYPIYTYRNEHDGRCGTMRVCPVDAWSTDDVWACIAQRRIPVLDAYDDGPEERTTLRLTDESIADGVLGKLRARDPDSHRRLIDRFPYLTRLT